jgi:hypothetical protein
MGDSFFRRQLYEQMDVIWLYIEFDDCPMIDLSALCEQLVQPPREWASQDPFAILGDPHQVILEAVGRVCSYAILAHIPSMPEDLRGYKPTACIRSREPFIPGLKTGDLWHWY